MEDLGPGPQGFREALGTHRKEHELLDVDRIVGVGAAVDHVHERGRQNAGADAAQIAVEGLAGGDGGGLGDGEAHGQERVRTKALLSLRTVELDHGLIDGGLVERVEARDRVRDLAVDSLDSAPHAFAEIPALVAVAQLQGLARAGGSTRRHGGTAERTALEDHLGLDRGVPTAVQDLPAADDADLGLAHCSPPCPFTAPRRGRPWPARRSA